MSAKELRNIPVRGYLVWRKERNEDVKNRRIGMRAHLTLKFLRKKTKELNFVYVG